MHCRCIFNYGQSDTDLVQMRQFEKSDIHTFPATSYFAHAHQPYHSMTRSILRNPGRRKSGCSREVRTTAAIKTVRDRLRTNPKSNQPIMAREIQMLKLTMSRLMKYHIRFWTYSRCEVHPLKIPLKSIMLNRSKKMKCHSTNGLGSILFNDENDFTVEEYFSTCKTTKFLRKLWKILKKIAPRLMRAIHPVSDGLVGSFQSRSHGFHFFEKRVDNECEGLSEDSS